MASVSICLVGAGNMGGALLGGWLASGHDASNITVIDPAHPESMQQLLADRGVVHSTSAEGVAAPDVVIVAVKPQIIVDVLAGLGSLVNGSNVLVSVAAGTTIDTLSAPFLASDGLSVRVVRTIPNTPCLVGRGITACFAGEGVSPEQQQSITSLLRAVGEVVWVDDEALIDVATGVSGSGPAYVFHLAEALARAGETAGLPGDLAARLAEATVSGAGELLRQADSSPATLRENVTSPNGTTAAALEILMGNGGFPDLLERAVAAATKRSRELAG